MNNKNNNSYTPGLCNLGGEEIESRKRKGIISLAVSIAAAIILYYFHYPHEFRLILFFPLFYSIICLYQAKKKFCVFFGMKGIFNFESMGKSTAIENEKFIELDRKLSKQMTLTCFLLALAFTIIFYFLPN